MDLARAPRRTRSNARKKDSGYENGPQDVPGKRKCIHCSCDVLQCKGFNYFWRNCHDLMYLRARFDISKPMIIRSSHKKYECEQIW